MGEKQRNYLEHDLAKIAKYSAENIKELRGALGEEAVERLPALVEKFTRNLSLSLFHETPRENIAAILKSGTVFSKDDLKFKKVAHVQGITYEDNHIDEMFNHVSYRPDPFTEFVYARPHFVSGLKKDTGLFVQNFKITDQCWFSFADANQLSSDDMYAVQMGMSVVKSFNEYDVFKAKDIPQVLVLKALEYMHHADYVCKIKKVVYQALTAERKIYPHLLPPDKNLDRSFEEELTESFLSMGNQSYHQTFAHDIKNHYFFRHGKELRAAGFDDYKIPTMSSDIFSHPHFETLFEQTLSVVLKEVAQKGQLAVPHQLPVKSAVVYLGGVEQKNNIQNGLVQKVLK